MCNVSRFRPLFILSLVGCLFLATGCGTQTEHPNQLNTFDGASYDSLTLAHGALISLRSQISVLYPKYAPLFDQAVGSYGAAENAYALYRTNPKDQAAVTLAIANLTVSIVALENAFQSDMHVSPAAVSAVRSKARKLRARLAGQNVTVSDILTELEIAAAVARTISAAQSYAGIASMIIAATSEAIAEEAASAGQPIDLATIQPPATL